MARTKNNLVLSLLSDEVIFHQRILEIVFLPLSIHADKHLKLRLVALQLARMAYPKK